MEQRTDEWLMARRGNFTASAIHKLMGARGLGQTGETYIYEVIASEMTDFKVNVSTFAMERGIELEPDAKAYFEIATGKKINEVGFVVDPEIKNAGCSPDGIIIKDVSGIEIKCPLNPEIHVKYMMVKDAATLKKIEPKYYWQIMMSMMVMRFDKWWFISYHPEFTGKYRMHAVLIESNCDDIDLIRERIKEATIIKEEIQSFIN